MKRGMAGGTHRGPVALTRQRRTIRLVQALLVLIAAGLLMFAGYSYGRVTGYDAGQRAGELDAPGEPSAVQTIVLAALGGAALVGALVLQGSGGVRIPAPARLEELAGRAEQVATERAEEAAGSKTS